AREVPRQGWPPRERRNSSHTRRRRSRTSAARRPCRAGTAGRSHAAPWPERSSWSNQSVELNLQQGKRRLGKCAYDRREMPPSNDAVLENPAYAALCGPHARFARVSGRVRRYEDDVAPFLALPSSPSVQDWRDAAALLVPGAPVAIRDDGAELPDGWRALQA